MIPRQFGHPVKRRPVVNERSDVVGESRPGILVKRGERRGSSRVPGIQRRKAEQGHHRAPYPRPAKFHPFRRRAHGEMIHALA